VTEARVASLEAERDALADALRDLLTCVERIDGKKLRPWVSPSRWVAAEKARVALGARLSQAEERS
jgi:hypothetical protein